MQVRGVRPAPAPPAEREGRASRRVVLAFAAAAIALVAVPLVAVRLVEAPAGSSHVFEIPAGTAARLAAGEVVDVLPAELDLRLHDTLVLVNHDVEAHQVGPLRVGPGERLERRFGDAVSLSGYCSLHAGDRIAIDVAPTG